MPQHYISQTIKYKGKEYEYDADIYTGDDCYYPDKVRDIRSIDDDNYGAGGTVDSELFDILEPIVLDEANEYARDNP